jgi:hypothetical protein
MVMTDLETLVTVPDDPPAAGPDRALDPPPREAGLPAGRLLDVDDEADAGADSISPTESAVIGTNSAAAMMLRHFILVSNGRGLARRTSLVVGTEAVLSGEPGGAASTPK